MSTELFDDGSVRVTMKRVMANGMTFPVSGISSVRIVKMSVWAGLAPLGVLVVCFGLYFASCGTACAAVNENAKGMPMTGLLIICGGLLVAVLSRRVGPFRYSVVIAAGGSDQTIAVMPSEGQAQQVSDAISEAIEGREEDGREESD
jgi:hypothetical protein